MVFRGIPHFSSLSFLLCSSFKHVNSISQRNHLHRVSSQINHFKIKEGEQEMKQRLLANLKMQPVCLLALIPQLQLQSVILSLPIKPSLLSLSCSSMFRRKKAPTSALVSYWRNQRAAHRFQSRKDCVSNYLVWLLLEKIIFTLFLKSNKMFFNVFFFFSFFLGVKNQFIFRQKTYQCWECAEVILFYVTSKRVKFLHHCIDSVSHIQYRAVTKTPCSLSLN